MARPRPLIAIEKGVMLRRSLIVWKLSALFSGIILVVLLAMGWVNTVRDRRQALQAAREQSRFNAETIVKSLQRLMMERDNEGVTQYIADLAGDNPIYRDIRLVSHAGQIAVSRSGPGAERLTIDSPSCQTCHAQTPPGGDDLAGSRDQSEYLDDGSRVVRVMTPILNGVTCRTADCHAHAETGAVLGYLQTDYSMSRVDQLIAKRNLQTLAAIAAAVALGMLATWIAAGRLLERPIRILLHGMRRLAEGELTFRFNVRRRDEFALVARTFNQMTARIEDSAREIRETKDYLQAIVENSADMIITVDPQGKIKTFNCGAEKILGYSRDEVIGTDMEALFVQPEDRRRAIIRLGFTESVINYETRFVTKGRDVRDVIVTLSKLRDRDGASLGTMGISKDVTVEKSLQRQLLRAERLAAIGQAVTGIQHSMKNMLNALKGGGYMVRLGLRKNDLAMAREGWVIVEEGIDDMTRLSAGMLGYVREARPELRWVDPRKILDRVTGRLLQLGREHGIEIDAEAEPGLPEVLCDPDLIHSVLIDLASNAVDACSPRKGNETERPRVVVKMSHDAGTARLRIEVADTGTGIDEEVQTDIFAPFFTTKKRKGTGLGLALARRLVEAHDGSIEVHSKPGIGSTFRVCLPVHGPTREESGDEQEGPDHR